MIDTKRLGSALITELQRRSIDKNADTPTLLEQLADGSGAHVFVGEKSGEVSLLVPIEDGFEGPKSVKVTLAGKEHAVLDVARRAETVDVEGVSFARFVLEPLRYDQQLVGSANTRPQVQLRGEGPDGLWSPLGFDAWFLADYNTLRWLATSDAMVVAPEVQPDPRDKSWKALDGTQRTALETILQRPVAAVVHDSELHEALKKVSDDGGVVSGALHSLALTVQAPQPSTRTRRAVDNAVAQLDKDATIEDLRGQVRAATDEVRASKDAVAELVKAHQTRLGADDRFANAVASAELVAARRQLQVVPLTLAPWKKPDAASPADVVADASTWLADLRGRGAARTLAALTVALAQTATAVPATAADKKLGFDTCFAFADGSKLHLGHDLDGAPAIAMQAADGRRVAPDLEHASPFLLPLTNDPGPTAALLDEKTLQAATGRSSLLSLGFVAITDRYFMHRDGSWAVIAPSTDGGAPRVAAGHGPRRYDLAAPATSRANALAALPDFAQKMLRLHPPAEQQDLQIMARQLAALDPAMLRQLHDAGYVFDVSRHKVSNAQADLKDATTRDDNGLHLVDNATAVHRQGADGSRSIVVRTERRDGDLVINTAVLLAAIGMAYDAVVPQQGTSSQPAVARAIANQRQRDPLHVEQDYADAYVAEHQQLPKSEQTQPRFFAHTFALFMLDPVRSKRLFPLAHAAHAQRFAAVLPNGAGLRDLDRGSEQPAIVRPRDTDLRQMAAQVGSLNKALADAGHAQKSVVFTVEGQLDHGLRDYVRDAARQLRDAAGRDAGMVQRDECFIELQAADFNNADTVRALLESLETAGRPALVLVSDVGQLNRASPGFAVFNSFAQAGRATPPLVLGGSSEDLKAMSGVIPAAMTMASALEPLTRQQQAEYVVRLGRQADAVFAPDATAAIEAHCQGGGIAQAEQLWRAIAAAQFKRVSTATTAAAASGLPVPLREVTADDVRGAQVPKTASAKERLAAMVGQAAAKKTIEAIVQGAYVNAARVKQGLPSSSARMNLLFEGAPGTGKTTYAEILGDLLKEAGAIKNPKVTKLTIQDFVTGSPEQAVQQHFAANKGGVIFIDEMHQLRLTDEGRRAFRAMIPLLSDAAYQDTVFIGAGYTGEMGDLIRNIDPGAERRFQKVAFVDYSKAELGEILDMKVKDARLVMDKPTRAAALAFVEDRRRKVRHFGNAGEIDVALNHARRTMDLRLSAKDLTNASAKLLMTLVPEDFAVPAPVSKADAWTAIDALSGLDELKGELRKMAKAIDAVVKKGGAPSDVVEPYWILDGPPGTGKTTVARALAIFAAAYGLTSVPDVVEATGASFQGAFVGQTAIDVGKKFDEAWGRLLFIDEVSGLAKSGGAFKDEAAKTMLTQMENNRGAFMMVVADYAHNINQFLALDPGLARRFGRRFTLPAWPAAQFTSTLVDKLKADGFDLSALSPLIDKQCQALAKVPGYASGGDVRTLQTAIKAGLLGDDQAIAKDVVQAAFAALIADRTANGANTGARP